MQHLGANLWAWAVLVLLLLTAAVTDVRHGKIFNWSVYPAVLIALAGHAIIGGLWGHRPGQMGLLDSVIGLVVGFAPLGVAWLGGGIGGGDAKLTGAIGALVGWEFALTILFFGLAVAVVLALLILLHRRMARETFGRIGRFLLLWLVKTRPGGPAGPNSPTVPLGLALCIGAALSVLLVWASGATSPLLLGGGQP
jgi:prepilin peptidase CpaA